ncbi:prepilin-type N-terminal cleavage/methylation domain-containing protein [Staphylococcus aureus]|nr:prepilin-type N-terminal cleavage/methylation domain-containing protein [Staphylococcus aureus]
MILSKVTNKFVLFQKIPLLIKRHVYSINVKAFSLIEMLVAMMVISITLLIVPDLIRLNKTFLIESRELTTVDFEFFSRDILEDFKGVDRNDIEIRQQRIILHKGEEMIEYKLINNKIIKVVNDRGNITMINNVTAFTANIYYKSIIKITITVKVGTNLQTKTIYFSIFTFYISQYSLKLKTLYNIETDYNYKIVLLLKEGKTHES